MPTEYFDHIAAYTAIRIRIEIEDNGQTKTCTGTGFLYLAEIPLGNGETRSKLLLISNKHVLMNGQGKLLLSLNRRGNDGKPILGDVVDFAFEEFDALYFGHTDNDVDLACVDVSTISHGDAYLGRIGPEFLIPIDYEKVALGGDVVFIGYPNDYYDIANNLPLVRKGTLASMPNVDFNGKGVVVIDAEVFSGSSGSPVFVDWDNKYRLLGVVSDTVEGYTPSGVPAVVGLGIVVKQRHVVELIDHVVKSIQNAWAIVQGR